MESGLISEWDMEMGLSVRKAVGFKSISVCLYI